MSETERALAGSVLFKSLTGPLLRQLAGIAQERYFRRHEAIFFEGEEAEGFHSVVYGLVKVFKVSLEGKEQILHVFGPGEPFGEVPVFNNQPFPANAVSLGPTKTLFFPRLEFVGLLNASPALALAMLAVLSMRLRRFAAQIEGLALKDAPGRLAAHLVWLAKEQGRTDQVILDIPKGQLASLLGTSPETLSRIFASMSEEGLIRVDGKRIAILKYEELLER